MPSSCRPTTPGLRDRMVSATLPTRLCQEGKPATGVAVCTLKLATRSTVPPVPPETGRTPTLCRYGQARTVVPADVWLTARNRKKRWFAEPSGAPAEATCAAVSVTERRVLATVKVLAERPWSGSEGSVVLKVVSPVSMAKLVVLLPLAVQRKVSC